MSYRFNLPWFLLALIAWALIGLVVPVKQFWHAFLVGLWTMALGAVLEQFFVEHKFWVDHYLMVQVGEMDLFLIIGPFFAVRILLVRFLPPTGWGKSLTVAALAGLSTAIEFVSTSLGFLVYNSEKWGPFNSYFAYYVGLMSALGFYYLYYNGKAR